MPPPPAPAGHGTPAPRPGEPQGPRRGTATGGGEQRACAGLRGGCVSHGYKHLEGAECRAETGRARRGAREDYGSARWKGEAGKD